MKLNVGGIDRVIRIVVGLALVGWAAVGGPVWAWIGVLPLATGAIGWCPPARSMIERRRMPSSIGPSAKAPSSSGPR